MLNFFWFNVFVCVYSMIGIIISTIIIVTTYYYGSYPKNSFWIHSFWFILSNIVIWPLTVILVLMAIITKDVKDTNDEC